MNAQLKPAIAFNAERGVDVIEEIAPLLEQHWREIAHYPDIPMRCDYATYLEMEARGQLRIYTVRNPALIGYGIFVVRHSLHYADSLQAVQDVIYLDPEHRLGRVGMRFVAWCEQQLKCEGVQVIVHHVKQKHPALGRILEHQGYQIMDVLYTKRLDL